MMQKDITLNIC